MKPRSVPLLLFLSTTSLLSLKGESMPGWKTTVLHNDFYAEGAAFGDIDGDGISDLVSGPFWYQGPTFNERREFYKPVVFDIRTYSDNFFSFIEDINADGWNDIVVFGFPAKEARVYVNPGRPADSDRWPVKIIADDISHEAPHWVDIISGGLPEIVCARGSAFGYYEAGENPTGTWTWNPISEENETGRFGHGMGVADIDGDGKLDLIAKRFWWKQPSGKARESFGPTTGNRRRIKKSRTAETTGDWSKNNWYDQSYGRGAQILFHDVDGDGDGDIITSLNAHGHGLAWYEKTSAGNYVEHLIMGERSTDNAFGVSFSQLHAMALADIDGDGLQDIVTGKRWYAHHGKDPGGHQEPVVYWFRCVRGQGGVEFVPHLVDNDSGVGVEVLVDDLNNDGRPDIVSANKHGLAIHVQDPNTSFEPAERWKVAGGRPQDNYRFDLNPEDSRKIMEVPDGFHVDLIQAEPELVQPVAMCFDARGRIWVIEGLTYPRQPPAGEGADRILIFEDTDADGSFESRKVFAEGLNLASGIEVGFGGVFVGAAPHLLFFPDKNSDDIPDGKPEILLDGWGYDDTHETLNSFTWGPDGWLYGCHGVFTHSKVGSPGTPDSQREKLNAGVWRYHPTKRTFEVFAYGTSNPWGIDFNELGDFFISACVIPHLYHMIQGGRYRRQGRASHFNPYTFESIDTMADHVHYASGLRKNASWNEKRSDRYPTPADTSELGGGHAHCGLALYLADTFPSQYQGQAFFHNLHGHRLVRESLETDGSGYIARHRPGFLFARDHDFIGVGVMLGPDGALYFSDWHDSQTCHHTNVEAWDRSNGRLFRVRHGSRKPYRFDLKEKTDTELTQLLAHPNAYFRRQAQRLLQERAHTGMLDADAIDSALKAFSATDNPTPLRLRSLWTRWVCGLLGEADLIAQLGDANPHVRAWAIQLLGEDKQPLREAALAALLSTAEKEDSAVVLRYLASLMQRIPMDQRWGVAGALLQKPEGFARDKNLSLVIWYGMESLVGEDPVRAMAMVENTQWEKLKNFTFRRASINAAGRKLLVSSLANASEADTYLTRAQQLNLALETLPPVSRPDSWGNARRRGLELAEDSMELQDLILRISTRFGDTDTFPKWRSIALDRQADAQQRVQAVDLLLAGGDEQLKKISMELLDDKDMRETALDTLAHFPGSDTAQVLIQKLNTLPAWLRNQVVNALSSTSEMALALLKAVDGGTLESTLISPVLLQQISRFENKNIQDLIASNWKQLDTADTSNLEAAIREWKEEKLTGEILEAGNAAAGRLVFRNTCGTCHKFFGEGADIGPNLTGSNRVNLDYVLENVLAPNAVVSKDYLINIFKLNDGRVISGMIQEETPEFVTVAMPGGTAIQFSSTDVAERRELNQSFMSAGLFNALPLNQVSDLIAYLASPEKVPLPGED